LRPGLLASITPKKILFWSAPLICIGCGGGGGTDVVLPALSVTTTTGGLEVDPDGYTIRVDGAQQEPIGANATVVVDELPEGAHTVSLDGLAGNCTAGDNPRSITVRSGATATADFTVTCSTTTGSVEVLATTSGTSSDPDGFSVIFDGADRGAVAPGVAATFDQLPPGTHTIGLSGVAANCQVAGDNPRAVSVTAAQTTQVSFTATCAAPGPSSGSLVVTTGTSGSDQDPDGYSVQIDNAAAQPIGTNASLTLINVIAGEHTVRLLDLSANCAVTGTNPAHATVAAAGSVTVSFAVVCTPIIATTGGVEVSVTTSGDSPDADGYSMSVDGGAGLSLGVNGSRQVTNLTSGSHTVALSGLAGNCTVAGDNPRTVSIAAGQDVPVAFSVSCPTPSPTTGSMRITVATTGPSPDADGYTFSLDNGQPQSIAANGTRTVGDLQAGTHTVQLGGVAQNCTLTGDNPWNVTITAGQATAVPLAVSCASTAPSLNLRIERISVTQSTQHENDDIPLVEGRDAFIRVFVVATGSGTARPSVRVRLYQSGSSSPSRTLTLQSSLSAPETVDEGNLNGSWNALLAGADIQPGLSILADVDPDNALAESNDNDNSFPTSGAPQKLTVRSVPAAAIRFVPVQQSANNSVGDVNSANKDRLVDYARRVYPLREIQTAVHEPYTTTTSDALTPDDLNQAWETVLGELNALRVTEGSNDTYFGIAHVSYQSGLVGIAYLGTPTGLAWDDPADASRAIAHELGHTWGMLHTPCGGPAPGSIDPKYPYSRGNIGVYGYDVNNSVLKPPTAPDIMGYCDNPWVSDYTYQKVLDFRGSSQSVATAQNQPSLLVWGRIVNGQPVLEPVFQIMARPSMPSRPGAYSIEGSSADGSRLFGFSFDPLTVPDGPTKSQHFAFTVPVDDARAAQLRNVRLSGPGGRMSAQAPAAAAVLNRPLASEDVLVQQESQGITVRWNAAAHPMVMVRDPDTGEVLSFARGGNVRVWTQKRQVDLDVSDGVRSQRLRRAISR
jgi:hypothetical protein